MDWALKQELKEQLAGEQGYYIYPAGTRTRFALVYPNSYHVGMSNLGMRILYHTMNSLPFVWCERVFAPWGDMYQEMKQSGIPLYALESGDPLSAFDSLAFSPFFSYLI